jgi:hypothetical protein
MSLRTPDIAAAAAAAALVCWGPAAMGVVELGEAVAVEAVAVLDRVERQVLQVMVLILAVTTKVVWVDLTAELAGKEVSMMTHLVDM